MSRHAWVIASILLVIALIRPATGADWQRYRGPAGDGVSSDAKAPLEWNDTKNIKWKTALPGPGSSSPIVWGDYVFVTCYSGYGVDADDPGAIEKLKRHLLCLKLDDGKVLWSRGVAASLPEDEFFGMGITEHGYASSTPVTDGQRVYVFFGKTGVLAFDFQGKELWRTNVGHESANRHWGSSASPILYGNTVIVNAAEESRSIRALDTMTGKEKWKAESAALELTYATPLVVDLRDGRKQLVIGVPGEAWGLNPETGKLSWYAETALTGNVAPSPVAQDGIVYFMGGFPGQQTVAIRAGGKGDVTKSNVLWSNRISSYVPSPLLCDGKLYWVSDMGLATCVEAATGKSIYREKLPRATGGRGGEPFYASVVLIKDRLYAVSRSGDTYVFPAKPKFEVLAQNSLASDKTDFNASPAVSNGKILLRSNRFLYCIGGNGPSGPEDTADDRPPPRDEGGAGPRAQSRRPGPRQRRDVQTVVARPANPAPAGLKPKPSQHAEPGPIPGFVQIPAGEFDMGDHQGFGNDEGHPSDEVPIHRVHLDSFSIATTPATNQQYCDYLNAALAQRQIQIKDGHVFSADGKFLYCDTHDSDAASSIQFTGGRFVLVGNRANHPVVCIRWHGAAACCNWMSQKSGYAALYDPATGLCDYAKPGFRLPTEAEWEYAGRGGLIGPYYNFPWGDDPDVTKANWPESHNPFQTGPYPWTTPVGFYNGELHRKADFHWPGTQESYQTANGANGYGLYDMAGNVWQWVNDWYDNTYYGVSPADNPHGPDQGRPMRDGKPYRGIRGGSWYNGEWGHSRVSNRNPSYYRGPQDPNHRWYHIGFRVVLKTEAPSPPALFPRTGEGSNAPLAAAASPSKGPGFVVKSPKVTEGGMLPKEFTGDGAAATLPLEWSGAPAGTKSYAVIMHHIPGPGSTKWYWVLYDIPASVTSLPKNVKGIGTLGNNSVNRDLGYAPPHSKGPGPKKYTFTVYALAAAPQITVPPEEVSRDVLLAAIKGSILASAELNVIYTRDFGTDGHGSSSRPDPEGSPPPPPRRADEPASREPTERPEPPRAAAAGGQPVPGGHTVGLFKNDPKTCAGYTLFAPKHHTLIYLIDNEGRAVHCWKSRYEPGQSVCLLENGHLLHCCFTKNRGFTSGGEGGRLEEFDWDGNLVWEFEYSNNEHLSHHDVKPLPNGNVLVLAVEKKTYDDCLAAGFNPRMLRDQQLFPEFFIEVQPTRPTGGKIVWEWHVWDHLIQDNDRTKANYGDVAAHPELISVNCNGRGAPAFWNHGNSIAYNPQLDQIMLSARGCNEIWVVDHGTTTEEAAGHTGGKRGKGGDLLYRWGNPAAYQRGDSQDRKLFQQHDAQWIPEGYPGAGHILIFNNGLDRGYSTIEEIVPPMDDRGMYLLPSQGAFGPSKPVWRYEAEKPQDFYSSEISGAHRLPNGNTLICAGVKGTFFEVTPAGETVWQYVNPVVHNGILAQGELSGLDHRGHNWNAVFKIHRYPPDYPGLAGKDLKPIGPIEQPELLCGKTGFHDQAAEGAPVGREGRGGNRPGSGERRPPRDDNQGGR